jgi:hypothetical protein
VVAANLTTSVLWAAGGRVLVTVPLNQVGTLKLTVSRTVGGTTQTFGPQAIVVRKP